jgi:phenazine biosynthesis protein phzE
MRVPVGATLVRGSDPYGEVLETHAKAAGVLRAFGAFDAADAADAATASTQALAPAAPTPIRWAEDPQVKEVLAARNERLSPAWAAYHAPGELAAPELAGRGVLIIDNEDAFTSMLAVQLRSLGLHVTRLAYDQVEDTAGQDLVVLGPGPGDPRDLENPKMRLGRAFARQLTGAGTPLLAICLGHQMLCAVLGFELHRRATPNQGTQVPVGLFGRTETVGFYNSYAALAPAARDVPADVRIAHDGPEIAAVRGPGFAGLQFHPESVLTMDGLGILRRELDRLLGVRGARDAAG